jgi:hypothetical protein
MNQRFMCIPGFLAAWAASAQAQLRWEPAAPECRAMHTLTFDSARGEAVLVGGEVNEIAGYPVGTFVYNGGDWVHRASGDPPAGAVWTHLMPKACFDDARGVLVLGGGAMNQPALWEWDGTAWANRPQGLPGGNVAGAMAFDAGRGRTVVYGPATTPDDPAGRFLEWDGAAWTSTPVGTQLDLDHREGYAAVYDAARGVTLVAGWQYTSPRSFLTWAWDGAAATLVGSTGPMLRRSFAMAYDAHRQRTVLFGGENGNPLADTWEWDGSPWAPGPSGPPARGATPWHTTPTAA